MPHEANRLQDGRQSIFHGCRKQSMLKTLLPQSRAFVIVLATILMIHALSQPSVLHGQQRMLVSGSRMMLGTESNRSASVRLADLDGDDDLDAIIANGRHWPQQNFLLLNQTRSRFNVQRNLGQDRATSYATEVADLDGDGDLDVAVGNDMAPNRIFFNDGSAHFSPGNEFGEISSIRSLTLSDLDGDGDVDILGTCRGTQNHFYRNDGKGNFGEGEPYGDSHDSTIDVAVGDLNLDGHPDLVLANRDGQMNCLLLNDGRTQFTQRFPFGTGKNETRAVAIADMNRDGNPDVVAANIGQTNTVYLGDGSGGLRKSGTFGRSDGLTYAVAIADMNNDGILDIVTANVNQQNAVFFHQGDGKTFAEVRFGEDTGATYGMAIGDLDRDGFKDVAVANSDSFNRIFLNRPRRKEQ